MQFKFMLIIELYFSQMPCKKIQDEYWYWGPEMVIKALNV